MLRRHQPAHICLCAREDIDPVAGLFQANRQTLTHQRIVIVKEKMLEHYSCWGSGLFAQLLIVDLLTLKYLARPPGRP